MFYDIVGKSDFFTVCSKWLNQSKNKSVEIPEFLKLVNKTLHRYFDNFFDQWLKKVGFPFLFVEEILSPEGNKIGIKITQIFTRGIFFNLKVPILYEKNGKSQLIEVMLDKLNKTVDVEFDWIIVNDVLIEQTKLNKISKYNIYLINISKKVKNRNGFLMF